MRLCFVGFSGALKTAQAGDVILQSKGSDLLLMPEKYIMPGWRPCQG